MRMRWMVVLLVAAAACGGGGGFSAEELCPQVARVRELPFGRELVDGLAELAELAEVTPGGVAADLDTVVRFSEDVLTGTVPSVAATEEAQEASDRVRREVRRRC